MVIAFAKARSKLLLYIINEFYLKQNCPKSVRIEIGQLP
ncbi:hypothetical protein DDD_0634 [Nonlabens dokdonensis DSW-6]|uniref:Uncharacterized protein n=1 Tax=Nonlabens dokdonensis (strain DSM 17205 / KCTC 12402 / DSW-6) TaxID=592029 RepID=L7W2P7_NONDD|nr:hypothetical protein DDD_0634 [Nonlabens dokdonensis DSW-6]